MYFRNYFDTELAGLDFDNFDSSQAPFEIERCENLCMMLRAREWGSSRTPITMPLGMFPGNFATHFCGVMFTATTLGVPTENGTQATNFCGELTMTQNEVSRICADISNATGATSEVCFVTELAGLDFDNLIQATPPSKQKDTKMNPPGFVPTIRTQQEQHN